jgi:hypothetical protein
MLNKNELFKVLIYLSCIYHFEEGVYVFRNSQS